MVPDDGALNQGLAVGILADIAQEFSSLEDWQARVKRALSIICRALHSGTAAVAVRLEGWHNFFCPGFHEDEGLCTTMRQHYSILSGTELFVSEAVEETSRDKAPGSIISLPVTGADRVLGVLHLSAEETDAYSLQDVSLLSVMASQLGSYMMNVLSHQQEAEARQKLMQARDEAEKKAAELHSLFTSMADGVVMFDEDRNTVYMNQAGMDIIGLTPDSELEVWSKNYYLQTLDGKPLLIEQYPSVQALRGEINKDVRLKVVSPWSEVTVSASSSPVKDTRGRIIGATVIFRDVRERVELELQRDELLKREHKIAETLQKALVPPETVIEIQGCSIALKYEPGLKEAEIGGDFYDIFELHEDKIGILIGDVVGKGLPAAISVASARYSIRSYAYSEPSPGKVLAMANEAVIKGQQDVANMFTAFFIVLDTRTGEMVYASGGHEPLIICDSNGNIEEVHVVGRMLGVLPDYEYPEGTRILKPGDRVVMVTDGIPDARSDSMFFGMEGIEQYVKKHHSLSPREIASGLLNAAKEAADGSIQDDAAIVVLEYGRLDSR